MDRPIVVGIGEILWDLLPEGKRLGGAPANFAYHAAALGAQSYIVSAVGDDPAGKEILEYLRLVGLDASCIEVKRSLPTGTVSVQLDPNGVPAFIIHKDVAWDSLAPSVNAAKLAQAADAICFGTLAQRSESSRKNIQQFLDLASSECLRIFDVNLRQSYYSRELVLDSIRRCNVLKLNEQELPVVAEMLALRGSESEILRTMVAKFDLRLAALTLGKKGSRLAYPGGISTMDAPKLAVVDTVGAGDAFTAALAVGLMHGLPLAVTHADATKLASFVCTQRGALPDASLIRRTMDGLPEK